ncbi:peptidase [Priestia abyssalis]|uniref:peptidase n=1 Tax=Priestia abyssalis TaxID=1221450 RepID=UPI000995A18E|nr:peptidase [Priestia abyssalis]
MEQYKERIHQWLLDNRSRGTRILKRLVQEASVQGAEKYAQALIVEKLRQLGLPIDIWTPNTRQLQQLAGVSATRMSFQDSPNVAAVLKGTGGGRSIILNGHVDVVPEGDESSWTYDAYSAYIKEGKLYGRGSSDMKGGQTALLLAIEAIISLGISLKGDLIFQSVIEGEGVGAGTAACLLRGYQADAALIPEPTNMQMVLKQQGSMWFRIKVKGPCGHGRISVEGKNVIEKAVMVIDHLRELDKVRNRRLQGSLSKGTVMPTSITIGKIGGGTWPSSFMDTVTLEGRMGVGLGETLLKARHEMEEWLGALQEIHPCFEEHSVVLEWFGVECQPCEVDSGHELVKVLTTQYKLVKREELGIGISTCGTDGSILSNIGHIPVILFGPGKAEAAHFPDEYIELDHVFEAAEIIALTVINWCGTADE